MTKRKSAPQKNTLDSFLTKGQQISESSPRSIPESGSAFKSRADSPTVLPSPNPEILHAPKATDATIGIHLEGIEPGDVLVVPRDNVCARIVEYLSAERAVMIRAPPCSGKTSLASLMQTYAKNAGYNKVLVFKFLTADLTRPRGREITAENYSFISLLNSGVAPDGSDDKFLLIVDEAQCSYSGYESFWQSVKALMQNADAKVHILLFAAFGESMQSSSLATPVAIQRYLGINVLKFSREEFDELIRKFNLEYAHTLEITTKIAETIFRLTEGVPGITKSCLHRLKSEFVDMKPFRRRDEESDDEGTVITYLVKDFPYQSKDLRAIPSKWEFQEDEVKCIRTVIQTGSIKQVKLGKASNLLKYGIIAGKSIDTLGFTCPIVRNVCLDMLFGEVGSEFRREPYQVTTLVEFLRETIRMFRFEALKTTLSCGVNGNVYEGHLQFEFYRCAFPMARQLENLANCHTEVGAIFGSKGYLDFYLNSDYKWGVELVRNSSKLNEHLQRFSPLDGIYAPIPFNDWAVVNFVQQSDCKGQKRRENLSVSEREIKVVYSLDSREFLFIYNVHGKHIEEKLEFYSRVQKPPSQPSPTLIQQTLPGQGEKTLKRKRADS